MKKRKEIIRLFEETELSQRQISSALKVSRPVVSETIKSFENITQTYQDIKDLSDSQVEILLSDKPIKRSDKAEQIQELFSEMAIELKKVGVTRQLLWQEYLVKNPDGLRYSQFCYYFQQWQNNEKITMHINHKAGDKMFVDYTGQTMVIIDRITKKETKVQIFVAILPSSQITYVEASPSQSQENFIKSNENALHYFGGVPAAIVPDNLKAGVLKANTYEPTLNPLFEQFAEHYQTTILPARARKPKDKSHVENAVKIIYTRIFAPLRNKTFYNIDDLNKAIKDRLEEHNNTKLTKMTVTRRELFESVEQESLLALPVEKFPIKSFQSNTLAQFNYHVLLKEDQHYYSVPYQYRGEKVKIIYDKEVVSIYFDNIRIAFHKRDFSRSKYSTIREHMPEKHRYDDNWNPEKIKNWASGIGKETLNAVTEILDRARHPEQAYKSCMGILSLSKKYSKNNLNQACKKAKEYHQISYKYISKSTKYFSEQSLQQELSFLPQIHENVRGKKYYKQENQL